MNHTHTGEVTCPHCGAIDKNSWERSQEGGDEQCDECEGFFYWSSYIERTFSTKKTTKEEIEAANAKVKQRWDEQRAQALELTGAKKT